MLFVYNIVQILLLILLSPVIIPYILLRAKYRSALPERLGRHLKSRLSGLDKQEKTVWIHALSVGEVTSALPLVARIRSEFPKANIVFSSTTQTGFTLARDIIAPHCHTIIRLPLDLYPVCHYFIRCLRPSLFILVETDFWPNLLHQLAGRNIPSILVNGRISKKSMAKYSRYSLFFKPMFNTLSRLCVQTESDRQHFISLGLEGNKIFKLGNLKYEPLSTTPDGNRTPRLGRGTLPVIIAGSTHPGEEEIILDAVTRLCTEHPVFTIIAPRNADRGAEVAALAQSRNLTVSLRSEGNYINEDLLVLDSIGELASFYALGDICIVGGSLVPFGGHNPLEPASHGKVVLFGPHMDDFEEISRDLLLADGAFTVNDGDHLFTTLKKFIENPDYRQQCGEAAGGHIKQTRGVISNHIDLIREVM